jgi:hypothetical protein
MQSIPWDQIRVEKGSTQYRQVLSLNETYIIGVVNLNSNCSLKYNIAFNREARGIPIQPTPSPRILIVFKATKR